VVEKYRNPLTEGLEQALSEVRLGRSRSEALESFARRSSVDEVQGFLQATLQSEQLGVPVARILRVQADDIRWRRRRMVSEQAAQASIKMLLPMIVFIMPTIWLILLGPAIIEVMQRGL
jgi:tight adherence protein C